MKKKLILALLVAVAAPTLWLGSGGKPRGADPAKPFKETGTEYIVTDLAAGSLPQPLFKEARGLYGPEFWSGVMHQFSQNNVGGSGNSVAFETVHRTLTGVIVYVMKYETVANGDRFVMAGSFVPQADGSLVGELWFIPEQGTGRFAGATGTITDVTGVPGGYILEGTITTVGDHHRCD
jgi:hypothetical protein